MTALLREHTTPCARVCERVCVRVCGRLHASNVNSLMEGWALSGQLVHRFVFCEWSALSLCSRRKSFHWCVCVLPFQNYQLSLIPQLWLWAQTSAAHTHTLLGNTRLQYGAVAASGIGWCSTVGGDLVTIYNLGSRVLAPRGVNLPAWWSTEPLQPVSDALDVHVHCCTADRLSPTKATSRQCVTQPQTA